jgi:type IV secretory pathway TraG/TraD family ATPase VirD4
MGVSPERIIILNPFDDRCSAWDLAKDVRTPPEADDLAGALIPKGPGDKDPYFIDTAQRFLAGIIEVFQETAADHWELRDLILASKNTARLRAILASSPNTSHLIEHLEPYSTYRSVKSTLDGHMRAYRSIAASWHGAKKRGRSFGIEKWLQTQSVLVLGNSPKAKLPISRVNQLLFTGISKAILNRPGRRSEETFIFLDEFRELGKLNNIADLMITGRSKGAAVVLGFQDVYGVDSVYGREQSREIIGCAQNLGILHLNSTQPDTQKWASEVLGDHEVKRIELGNSKTTGGTRMTGQVSESFSYRHKTEKVWLPSQFATDLPPASRELGLTGLFRVENEFFTHHYPGENLFGDHKGVLKIPHSLKSFPDQVPVKRSQLLLSDWNCEDLARLGILEIITEDDTLQKDSEDQEEDLLFRRQPARNSAA